MNRTAIIFGAGKTGRGFAAHLAFLGKYNIVLVDKNKSLIDELHREMQYDIEVLGCAEKNCTVKLIGAYHTGDVSWHGHFNEANLVFTAVFGNNLEELGNLLGAAVKERRAINPEQLLTIITCENFTNAAAFLKSSVEKVLDKNEKPWLETKAGFSESMIFRTCLEPTKDQPRLTVRAQNYFELPCDGDAIKQSLDVFGLKPLTNFAHQLRRKIYTYNCINAIITYLGAAKGYDQLCDAANDAEILKIAQVGAKETALAQIAEFGFDSVEQEEWTNAAFLKFSDRNVPDPIERNGADPKRKLARNDRLIGPALLALKHGIEPLALVKGIEACFNYYDHEQKSSVSNIIREKGIEWVLENICGLLPNEELFALLKQRSIKPIPYEK